MRDLGEDVVARRAISASSARPAPARAPGRPRRSRSDQAQRRAGRAPAARSPSSAVGVGDLAPPSCRGRRRRGTPRGRARPPSQPISAGARATISGNGTSKKKIATKAAAASADQRRGCSSARRPMRSTASTTIASTAALRPKNSAATERHVAVQRRRASDSAMIATKPGQHEQRAGDEPARGPVQQPADVDRELLRLGAGQQHAVVERVQEAALADPALLLDEDAVHHRDLAGRPAEAQRGDARPDPHRLGERDAVGGHVGRRLRWRAASVIGPA